MVPYLTSTRTEAPAGEARQHPACQTLASDTLASDAPASEAAARNAPASKECHFLRIPPGELSGLMTILDELN